MRLTLSPYDERVHEEADDPDPTAAEESDVQTTPVRYNLGLDAVYTDSISNAVWNLQRSLAPNLRVQMPVIEAIQAEALAKIVMPKFDFLKIIGQQVQAADFMKAALAQIDTNVYARWAESLQPLFRAQHDQIANVFAGLAGILDRLYPDNWRGISGLDWERVETILLEEGIPLAAVPRKQTVQLLLEAADQGARRTILARRWRSITTDCEAVLDSCVLLSIRSDVAFARKAIQALRGGHPEAAQALATNLLDSMLRKHLAADFRTITNNRKGQAPLDLDDYAVRVALIVAPIWAAYQAFWTAEGDPVPRTFARHATAHAVSSTQFSRANSVQALMIATSLLSLLQQELNA